MKAIFALILAAIGLYINKIVSLGSNIHRITTLTLEKLNSILSKLITELNTKMNREMRGGHIGGILKWDYEMTRYSNKNWRLTDEESTYCQVLIQL
jgi:hypothetical protein